MSRYPLFPLAMPLFPEQVMSLQIFEPRYISLVSECLKVQRGFGVVQIREGHEVGGAAHIFQFGVEAKIVDFEQLSNGLLGIQVLGGRKFSVDATERGAMNQLLAQVSWLADEPPTAVPDEFDGLRLLLDDLLLHPAVSALQLPTCLDARHLGWQLCQLLPLRAPDKVQLLALADPLFRLEQLAKRVEQLGRE